MYVHKDWASSFKASLSLICRLSNLSTRLVDIPNDSSNPGKIHDFNQSNGRFHLVASNARENFGFHLSGLCFLTTEMSLVIRHQDLNQFYQLSRSAWPPNAIVFFTTAAAAARYCVF